MWNPFTLMASLITELRNNTVATAANTAAVRQLNTNLGILIAEADELNVKLAKLLDRLRDLPDPGPISLTVTQENGTMLTFTITLPALPDPPGDIVSGLLRVTVGDGAEQSFETTKEQTEVAGLTGEQGQAVNADFVWIDDAGNKSANPSKLENVILADTIPPPDAGALGLVVTAES